MAGLMRVLVVNAGSSTLKLSVAGDGANAALEVDPWDGDDASEAFGEMLSSGPIDAVGHRIVHGGHELVASTRINDAVRARIAELSTLAPLHQPRALAALAAAQRALPDVPHVACFDTAFHAAMPTAARTYAIPRPWRDRWGLERFGFHGLSHAWAARRAAVLVDEDNSPRRIVTCHLGAGASLCAVLDGLSVDTTMGFTPLEGLVMATRSGSVDPGLVLWLITAGGLDADEVTDGLERLSGLTGLGVPSGDMREVLDGRAKGDEAAALAFDVYIHRLRREIAAMCASLGGLDALVFTGGVGEHAPAVRAATVEGLGFLGLGLDAARNEATGCDADVTADEARVHTLVVTAREDLEIAREVRALHGLGA
jgi:acetate kinase